MAVSTTTTTTTNNNNNNNNNNNIIIINSNSEPWPRNIERQLYVLFLHVTILMKQN